MTNFLKKNWAVIILIIIGILYLKNNYLRNGYPMTLMGDSAYLSEDGFGRADMMASPSFKTGLVSNYFGRQVPPSESTDRLIIQDTSLSLQVKDVAKAINEIEETTRAFGGFLISSHLSKPQDAASGSISVRIPEDKRKEAMSSFKNYAVKVVSESVSGTDVTDQYVDLEARLEVLNKTKIKYEEILQKAEEVKDLLSVQRELINLQSQIDSLKGQQKYFEQSAKLSKVVIYLSTDELALPYAPTNEWRPRVIFKEAVRSLIGLIRNVGSLIIWTVVFIPVIVPVWIIVSFIKRKRQRINI